MKGKKIVIYTCFSVLIILLNFVFYYGFSSDEKTVIQDGSFAFTIVSEIIFFGMIYLLSRKQENAFSRAGIASASVIYLVISLILNILMKSIFNTLRALITTNIIILIIYVVIILAVYLFKKEN